MEQLDINKLRGLFNRASQSVRIVSVFSPTCPVCLYGQGVIRGIFEEFGANNLKGFAVWLPMMPNDSIERADSEAAAFKGQPVVHVWDPERQLGKLYSRILNLSATAWDFYFLYAPGVRWEGNEPPQPTFWMHQLPVESGADRNLVLYPTRFSDELLKLLGDGGGLNHTRRANLGLELHWKGLTNLTRERSQYTIEDVREAFEDSRIVRTSG